MVQREEYALIEQHGPHDLLKRLPQVRAVFSLQRPLRRPGQLLRKCIRLGGLGKLVLPEQLPQRLIVQLIETGQGISIAAQLPERQHDPLLRAVFIAGHMQHQHPKQRPCCSHIVITLDIRTQVGQNLSLQQL